MEPLYISATANTPQITINPDAGEIKIVGSMYAAHGGKLFERVDECLDEMLASDLKKIKVTCAFYYLNTSAHKHIMSFFKKIDDAFRAGSIEAEAYWKYLDHDEDIREQGEVIFNHLKMPRFYVKQTETKRPQSSQS